MCQAELAPIPIWVEVTNVITFHTKKIGLYYIGMRSLLRTEKTCIEFVLLRHEVETFAARRLHNAHCSRDGEGRHHFLCQTFDLLESLFHETCDVCFIFSEKQLTHALKNQLKR